MNENVIGIDLGTSSVKLLQKWKDGSIRKAKMFYEEISPEGWWKAVCDGLAELDLKETKAISLSSQVGTYIVNDSEVIEWNSDIGTMEVRELRNRHTPEFFAREISMSHPEIASYPIPRLCYIKEHYESIQSVCQPKDYLCERLTGNRVTDIYSWRGLTNLSERSYSGFFLRELGIDKKVLPELKEYLSLAGVTKEGILEQGRLPGGIPVYIGLNDYYASLLGMGITHEGDAFDISGTSEHLGVLQGKEELHTPLVSGPYLYENVHYGVTASSGASIQFGRQLLKENEILLEKIRKGKPPVFLPYLQGERAPIWDSDAKGVYFGIGEGCTETELAYAAFEGVVFSLYHIYETMGFPKLTSLKVSGGAAALGVLNRMKAEMFEIPVKILEESDTSALGAAMIAAVGEGWYENLDQAIAENCHVKKVLKPTGIHGEWMKQRYESYKILYPVLRNQFQSWKQL